MKVRRTRDIFAGYLFLLPYLLLFTAFLLLPLAYGFVLSFMKYEMISPEAPHFVGGANYVEAMHDPYFWKALGAVCIFVFISVPLTIVVALALAVAIESIPDKRQGIYRLAIFLPTMITISVAAILWRWFFNSEFGLFNALLAPLGIKLPWLLRPAWAMGSIIFMTLWWTIGGPTIILLAGLKQIPCVYYEAGALDGAIGLRRFFYLTLPLLRPVLLFVAVINVIGAFQLFGQPFLITAGGPELSTRVLVQYIYETAFRNYRLGYGAAMSWLLFVVIGTFSILQFRVMRER
jgi:multiple sugar transport system permease protein